MWSSFLKKAQNLQFLNNCKRNNINALQFYHYIMLLLSGLNLTLSLACPLSGVSVGLWAGVESGVDTPTAGTSGRHVRSSLGTVEVKISWIQRHALSHISEENWEPLETTRFSRQLVPDLASCSLSERAKYMINHWMERSERMKWWGKSFVLIVLTSK